MGLSYFPPSPPMTPYTPEKTVQKALSCSRLTVSQFIELPGHLHQICLIHLSNGSRLVFKAIPRQNLCVLRTEQTYLETEATVLELLARTSLPIPQLLRYERPNHQQGPPFLLMTHLSGVPYPEIKEYLSRAERLDIEGQLRALQSAISRHTSYTYGPAGLVNAGEGFSNWRGAFTAMLESILMDGEDMLVNLPYHQIREAISRWELYLDDVVEARLVFPGLRDPANVRIDRNSNEVVGILDFGRALWGDPAMTAETREEGSIKDLL